MDEENVEWPSENEERKDDFNLKTKIRILNLEVEYYKLDVTYHLTMGNTILISCGLNFFKVLGKPQSSYGQYIDKHKGYIMEFHKMPEPTFQLPVLVCSEMENESTKNVGHYVLWARERRNRLLDDLDQLLGGLDFPLFGPLLYLIFDYAIGPCVEEITDIILSSFGTSGATR